MLSAWRRYVRAEDFVWLLLFTALAVFSPERNPWFITVLIALGVVQVLEPRIGIKLSIILKLALCYPAIYLSGGITSSYYTILLFPVISAATSLGPLGAGIVTLLACAMYPSFIIYLDFEQYYIPYDQVLVIVLRVLILPVVGFLTRQLAESSRMAAQRYQKAAEELAAANQSLKEAQTQVRRSERLAALGQLTAGLAHELRNPLGTMKTSAELLSRNIGQENAMAVELAGFISSEVDRVNAIITRFLDFARPQHLRLEQGNLAALLDTTIERFEREKSGALAGIRIEKDYSELPPLTFDAGLMERVFSNLIVNAAQASAPGGVVKVNTRLVDSTAEVSVIDHGTGIDPKNLESIFNPFFTTKAEGTGLGLAIVSKIVDEHGGKITVESIPGEGTVFRVCLPLGKL